MTTASTVISLKKLKPYTGILWGGLLCGILDITAAIVTAQLRGGAGPVRILQSIASGVLRANAYKGGFGTAALGLAIHFLIAYTAATVYYLLSRKLRFLIEHPLVCGPLYGIAVFAFMRLIVFPLASLPKITSLPVSQILIGLTIHMLFVGLPISLTIGRYSK
jgi:hypothetical protein